ncbi:MAG: succinylglutamate desuccinylase/aspartoacylase family protein [Rhodospirillaceae bacterium]|nr:MAG: succinylglutamate desuccinylase/aspartoacylase family protein [Rhodospirillaceae bacterium]
MSKRIDRITLPSMSPGTDRFLKVHRYGTPGAQPKAYLQASLHADEIPGMMAAHHLIRRLDEADKRGDILGEIIVVPVANPIGSNQVVNGVHAGRYELRGGGNFNRRWPDLFAGLVEATAGKLGADATSNVAVVRQAIGDRLSTMTASGELSALRLELSKLAYDADFVLDLHCDDDSHVHLFLIPDHWPEGQDLAALIGAEAVLLAADSGGASFDEVFSSPWAKLQEAVGAGYPVPAACLAATVEFRGRADVFDEIGEKDADALYTFLQRRGLIAGKARDLPAPRCQATMLDACDVVRSPAAGILAYKAQLGQQVRTGDVIAELIDPLADDQAAARQIIRCQTDGKVLSRSMHKLVAPGDSVAKVVGSKSLAYRTGLLLED